MKKLSNLKVSAKTIIQKQQLNLIKGGDSDNIAYDLDRTVEVEGVENVT